MRTVLIILAILCAALGVFIGIADDSPDLAELGAAISAAVGFLAASFLVSD